MGFKIVEKGYNSKHLSCYFIRVMLVEIIPMAQVWEGFKEYFVMELIRDVPISLFDPRVFYLAQNHTDSL